VPTGKGFKGTYRHTLDSKGRLAVPARFRLLLPDGGTVSAWTEGSLALWPAERWDEFESGVRALPVEDATSRQFARVMFGTASDIEFDAQGRIQVSQDLRTLGGLGLESTAVFVGVGDHAEIWALDAWNAYTGTAPSPEELMERLRTARAAEAG
jgi:MraZ protein